MDKYLFFTIMFSITHFITLIDLFFFILLIFLLLFMFLSTNNQLYLTFVLNICSPDISNQENSYSQHNFENKIALKKISENSTSFNTKLIHSFENLKFKILIIYILNSWISYRIL